MLILLSPAKTLDFTPGKRDLPATKPSLHADAKALAAVARELSPKQLARLMEISDSLTKSAHGYLQDWKSKWNAKGAKQAAFAFRGDVYQGLDADTLTDKQVLKAQDSLRILSGLYGVLRPLDLIQPYRLEMGRRLKNPRGADLYAWWGDRVTDELNASLAGESDPLVVNLASKEYWSVVRPERLDARVVTPVFKDRKGDGYRVLSFFAKRARGEMARHLIRSRSSGRSAIESFYGMGYRLNESLSADEAPVFTRNSADESQ